MELNQKDQRINDLTQKVRDLESSQGSDTTMTSGGNNRTGIFSAPKNYGSKLISDPTGQTNKTF